MRAASLVRFLTSATLAALLTTVGCAAPSGDDVDESAGAATVLDGSISEAEAKALRGEGLQGCVETLGDATLCTHPSGLVILTDEGIALLRARGDTITAKALVADEATKHDAAEVLDAIDTPEPALGGASLRPQGLAIMTANILRRIADALASSATKTPVAAAGVEAEVVATRSAALAEDLTRATKSLAPAPGTGNHLVTQLGGATEAVLGQTFRRWKNVTKRKAMGIQLSFAGGSSVSKEAVDAFFSVQVRAEKAKLAAGERIAVVLPDGVGPKAHYLAAAEREGVDVVRLRPASPNADDRGFAAVLEAPAGVWTQSADVMRRLVESSFEVTNAGVRRVF